MPRGVHLVGSVPLRNAREVFRTVSGALGSRLKRIPDGETGERSDWITWLEPAFADNPALEKSDELFRIHATGTARIRYRLRPGSNASDVRFDNLFYADVAKASYAEFAELKQQGIVPKECRFQIDLVPAHSVIWLFLQDDLHHPLDPVYNDALKREIEKISASLPHDQIAIQFDVASAVFARLQRGEPNAYGKTRAEMLASFSRILTDLADSVPPDIELMFHFCYGDSNHKHVVEPTDMGDMVDIANRLCADIKRSIQLIHMPVPRDRSDDGYFAPLARLRLKPETELSLGLVHYTDGVEGTRKRLATAERHVSDFSIATECGFGRRDPATIPELLRIHAIAAS
jgi:methionine synthase II (cobalamin-independent)